MTDGQEVRGINWEFNAWGGTEDGLYASWEKDNRFAPFFCEKEGYTWYDARPFVLEGGSVHSDGEGTVMVTESCLLSAARRGPPPRCVRAAWPVVFASLPSRLRCQNRVKSSSLNVDVPLPASTAALGEALARALATGLGLAACGAA